MECGKRIEYNKKKRLTNKKFCSFDCSKTFRRKGISQSHRKNISEGKKGLKLSISHREALSKAKKGKPIKHLIANWEENCRKISNALTGKPQLWNRGKNHPNYIDGGKAQYARQKDMGRVEYKNWRRAVFKRDDFTCQECKKRGGKICADHIKPYSLYPKLRYDVNNGKTLCVKCHRKTDTFGGNLKKYIKLNPSITAHKTDG